MTTTTDKLAVALKDIVSAWRETLDENPTENQERFGIRLIGITRRALEDYDAEQAKAGTVLSHDDLCRLSRVFNHASPPWTGQDQRINEWLKSQIAAALATQGDRP